MAEQSSAPSPPAAGRPRSEIFGFACLGLSIGMLVGLSGNAAVEAVASAVFALVGGSSILFVSKLDLEARRLASRLIAALSVFMLVGLFAGLWANQRELLGPKKRLATLEGVLAEVATAEIERRRAAGTVVSLDEIAKLMEIAGKSTIPPYLVSLSGGDSKDDRIRAVLHKQSIGVLDKEAAFDEIKEISLAD